MLGDPFCDLLNLNSNTHDVEYTKLYYDTELLKNTLHEDISHITHLTMERAHVIKIDHTKIKFVEYLIAAICNGDFACYLALWSCERPYMRPIRVT